MQVSGIGAGERLQVLGVPVVHDHRGGRNFRTTTSCAWRAVAPASMSLNQRARGWRLAVRVMRFYAGLPGILSLSPSVAYAFLHSSDLASEPELQFVFSPGSYRPGPGV
ncbi:MAG: hypothetical protein R3E68_15045 [Burkholderiaceae bacterium]